MATTHRRRHQLRPSQRPPLPWAEVNARDARDVAHALGLLPVTHGGRAVEGGRKFPCQWCASSNALHAYPAGGVHCFSCGHHASNIDLGAQVYGLPPVDALRQLAARLGVYVPDEPTGGRARLAGKESNRAHAVPLPVPRPPAQEEVARCQREAHLEDLARDGCVLGAPSDLYAALLAVLRLGDQGAAYLRARGLDAEEAARAGFRSIDDAMSWRELGELLVASYLPDQLEAAGLHRGPWSGAPQSRQWERQPPALVVPYWHRGAVVGLRFRSLLSDAEHGARYRSLAGIGNPPVPFNAEALAALDAAGGGELHIVEGELNAFTLAGYGLRAIGLPGAQAWRPEWAEQVRGAIGGAGRVVAWYDDDSAGRKGRAKLAATLAAVLGREWVAQHGRYVVLSGGDVNDFHRMGGLDEHVREARWRHG
jgi:hypothetical protein